MRNDGDRKGQTEPGATVVITHRVRDGQEAGYEAWMNEIGAICRAMPGHLDWQVIRPIPGLSSTYTAVIRFDTHRHLQDWMGSDERRRLVGKVRPLLARDDDFLIRSGLDFWFTPEGARAQVPVRWKQCLVTWSAIYPLVLAVPTVVAPLLRALGLPQVHAVDTLFVTGIVVALMIFVVMPKYTRLIRRWLFE